MEAILSSYSIRDLKHEISKRNIHGYWKLKRPGLHALIKENAGKFKNVKDSLGSCCLYTVSVWLNFLGIYRFALKDFGP